MGPDIYRVSTIGSGELCVMAKPTSGEWIDDEFDAIKSYGITRIVSLLERAEAYSVGLAEEARYCKDREIDFLQYEIADRGLPVHKDDYLRLISTLHADIVSGVNTVVHCRAGIGRTGLVAAGVLIRSGFSGIEAFDFVSKSRRVTVPDTDEQRDFVLSLEKELAE